MGYELDVSDLLADIRMPTLVVHRADDRAAPREQAEALAAGIPGARLVMLPGRSHLPYLGDAHSVVAPIRRFLGLRAMRRGPRQLTPRQGEVAALISEGCMNREIARPSRHRRAVGRGARRTHPSAAGLSIACADRRLVRSGWGEVR